MASGTSGPGAQYAARLARIAATGVDMHGEARFCDALLKPGSRVLDAGCGTGRVAARLAELGHDCVGVDVDDSMLEVARTVPGVRWVLADLAGLDLAAAGIEEPFDLVVAAGNVVPLVDRVDAPRMITSLAAALRPGGLLVTGFGLDTAHLPPVAVPLALPDFDAWCRRAGTELMHRHSTWDGDPFDPERGYAVSVIQRI